MTNFNLRNISHEAMTLLKQEASKQNISVNSLVLSIIDNSLGVSHPVKKQKHHDLDALAGTWSDKEKMSFEHNVKSFEKIDEDLWK